MICLVGKNVIVSERSVDMAGSFRFMLADVYDDGLAYFDTAYAHVLRCVRRLYGAVVCNYLSRLYLDTGDMQMAGYISHLCDIGAVGGFCGLQLLNMVGVNLTHLLHAISVEDSDFENEFMETGDVYSDLEQIAWAVEWLYGTLYRCDFETLVLEMRSTVGLRGVVQDILSNRNLGYDRWRIRANDLRSMRCGHWY